MGPKGTHNAFWWETVNANILIVKQKAPRGHAILLF